MDDLHDPQTDLQAPGMWLSAAALQPVYEINERVLISFRELGQRLGSVSGTELALRLPTVLSALDDPTLSRLARSPVAFVDARFGDVQIWTRIASGDLRPTGTPAVAYLPQLHAVQLAHMTLTLAWTIANSSRPSACLFFGMSRESAQVIRTLGFQTIQRLAELHPHFVRPRWENEPETWRLMVASARRSRHSRLPPLEMRTLLRQLAELDAATCVSGETRQVHR